MSNVTAVSSSRPHHEMRYSSSCPLKRSWEEMIETSAKDHFVRCATMDGVDIQVSPREKPLTDAFHKAIGDHGLKPADLPLDVRPARAPFKMYTKSCAAQGVRPAMEDYHFDSIEIPEGHMLGIFDGHGEKGLIAKYAGQRFEAEFSGKLKEHNYDVKAAFTDLCKTIHADITLKMGGTTVLICFIDKVTHQIYTAQVGDSHAKIYRMKDGKIYSIPLTTVKSWKDPEEAERAARALKRPKLVEEWTSAPNPKKLYFPRPGFGINCSRTLGDHLMVSEFGVAATSQEPIVTSTYLVGGDLLFLGCDGVWDAIQDELDEQTFIDDVIAPNWKSPTIHQAAMKYILPLSTDNVSIIAGWVNTDLGEADIVLSQPEEPTQPLELF